MSTLAMWTVYECPSDFPEHFVARRFEVDGSGARPTPSIIMSNDIETLRDVLCFEMRLTVLARDPADDPKIVETWL
jgi:hypothetical protein